jgi:recombinational DNA repair protein RecT
MSSAISFLLYLIENRIYLDDISYQFIVKSSNKCSAPKLTAHEVLKISVAKYEKLNNVIIICEPFTVKAFNYMKDNKISIKNIETMAALPLEYFTENVTLNTIAIMYVCMKEKEGGKIAKHKIFTKQDLYSIGRVEEQTKKNSAVYNNEHHTDKIEMLKKTAIRSFLKYSLIPNNKEEQAIIEKQYKIQNNH